MDQDQPIVADTDGLDLDEVPVHDLRKILLVVIVFFYPTRSEVTNARRARLGLEK